MITRKIKIKEFNMYDETDIDLEIVTKKSYPLFSKIPYKTFEVGNLWGGKDKTFWFVKEVYIPKKNADEVIYLNIVVGKGDQCNLSGSESLLYINKKPIQGIDKFHSMVKLGCDFPKDEKVEIALKSFSGLNSESNIFSIASIITINKEAESLFNGLKTTNESLKLLNKDDYIYVKLLNVLNDTINLIDFRISKSLDFYHSTKVANQYLKKELLRLKKDYKNSIEIYSCGHSHIDVAWLWRLKHTREKCARTFSTVLKLMRDYPEYKYLQSTPQLYEFVKEDYPEIYEEIKKRIKEERWEPTGGMWVEADCNIPSGESLVRQFLYGKKFFKREFDKDCKILWLPDVFGYSWALPQIIKKSDMEYFMTTKISWNQFNRTEYDTFEWKGIDLSLIHI